MTISASEQPLSEFVRFLSNKAGVSVVIQEGLESSLVSVEAVDQPVADVLALVARRAGRQLTKQNNIYYLGELKPEDRGVLVRRVPRLGTDELRQALAALASQDGRSAVMPDGLVVVGDRVEILERVHTMIDSIIDADSATWVVQLYVVSMSVDDARHFGFDVQPALEVAASLAVASQTGGLVGGAGLNVGLDAILEAARGRESVSLTAQPLFVLTDGEEGRYVRGDRIPVPRRVVSDQGTVSTEGFDFVQTGVNVTTTVRETSDTDARLSVDVQLSTLQGLIEGAPITSEESYNSVGVVQSGGVYLIGSMERRQRAHGRRAGLRVGVDEDKGLSLLQVWARAYRIGSDAGKKWQTASRSYYLDHAQSQQANRRR